MGQAVIQAAACARAATVAAPAPRPFDFDCFANGTVSQSKLVMSIVRPFDGGTVVKAAKPQKTAARIAKAIDTA